VSILNAVFLGFRSF